MAVQGQLQRNGDRQRVWNNGKWEEVEKVQTHPTTGQRRAITASGNVALNPKPPAAEMPMGMSPDEAQAWLAEQKQLDEVRRTADVPVVSSMDQEVSNQLPEQGFGITGSTPTNVGVGAARTWLGPEDHAMIAINAAKKDNPQAELIRDDQGNFIIDHGGQGRPEDMQRLNAEGISMTDALRVFGDISGIIAGGKSVGPLINRAGKLVGKQGDTFANMARTGTGQAVGAGTYAVGREEVGQAISGDDRSVLDTAGTAVEEGTGAGATQKILQWATNPIRKVVDKVTKKRRIKKGLKDTPAGQLSDTARTSLEKAGYPLGGMTDEEVAALNNALFDFPNLGGAELGRAIAKKVLMGREPTTGYVTQDPGTLFDENALRLRGGDDGATMTRLTMDEPQADIDAVLDPLDATTRQEIPLQATQETLAEQRLAKYEEFSGVEDAAGDITGGRFKLMRNQAGEYELQPEQIQEIRNNMYITLREATGAQNAGRIAGTKPDPEAPGMDMPEWGGYPDPVKAPPPQPMPKRPKNPRFVRPIKPKVPEELKGAKNTKARNEWIKKNDADHLANVKKAQDEHDAVIAGIDAKHQDALAATRAANQAAKQEAANATKQARLDAEAAYNKDVDAAAAGQQERMAAFEANPPDTDRVGGLAPAQTTGSDKPLTPADWLAWAEDISADPTQVGGKLAAKTVREELSKMAEEEALEGTSGGVLAYMQTHADYMDEYLIPWDPKRLVGNATTPKYTSRGYDTLRVSPERFADAIFAGRSGKFLNKEGAREAVGDLRDRLSPDEWIPVRQELIFRLLGGGKGRAAQTGRRSPDVMNKQFEEGLQTHGEDFIKEILDDGTGNGQEMLDYYRRFLAMSRDAATAPGKNSRIASDTAPTLARRGADLFAQSSGGLPGTRGILSLLREGTRRATGAVDESAQRKANRMLMDPNAAAYQPPETWRMGLLSQLYNQDD